MFTQIVEADIRCVNFSLEKFLIGYLDDCHDGLTDYYQFCVRVDR